MRRHHRHDGERGVLCRAHDAEHLGNPKVQKLRLALGRDQNVLRLDIPVDHVGFVSALHGGADLLEQPQPRVDRELVQIAILADRLPGDVLHHEIGQPVGSRAGVEYFRDIVMVQALENTALIVEAPQDALRIHAPLDQLDRKLLA